MTLGLVIITIICITLSHRSAHYSIPDMKPGSVQYVSIPLSIYLSVCTVEHHTGPNVVYNEYLW